MTARVTTLKGSTAGQYYVEELPHRNYYLDSGEPQGVWHGQWAAALGLDGEVADAEFLNLMAGVFPNMARQRVAGQVLYGEKSVRGLSTSRSSAPKSVSSDVLGCRRRRNPSHVVLAAHDTAVAATALGWVEDPRPHPLPHRRPGRDVVDAEGIIAATFRQHTSRGRLTRILHTHAVIANRVMSPDRRWLAHRMPAR